MFATVQTLFRAPAIMLAALTFAAFSQSAAGESIDLLLETSAASFAPGDVVDVDVFADVPTPLIGFGFDLQVTGGLAYDGFDTSPAYVGVGTPDGDDIAGLSFEGGLQGERILLGTAHYTATEPGPVLIALTATDGDLTEGFAQFGSGFFDISADPLGLTIATASVASGGGGSGGGGDNPIPEPATVVFLVSGCAALCRRRRAV